MNVVNRIFDVALLNLSEYIYDEQAELYITTLDLYQRSRQQVEFSNGIHCEKREQVNLRCTPKSSHKAA